MPLPNRAHNQQMRRALYSLKRDYGGTIDLYKLVDSSTDVKTGEKSISKTVLRIERAIVLPARKTRTAIQSISQISSNKEFVMGGTFDSNARDFIIDRRDTPSIPDLTADDWIVYRSRKFQISRIEAFEFDAGWVITAKELVGEVPEQIFTMRADNLLVLSDSTDTTITAS